MIVCYARRPSQVHPHTRRELEAPRVCGAHVHNEVPRYTKCFIGTDCCLPAKTNRRKVRIDCEE